MAIVVSAVVAVVAALPALAGAPAPEPPPCPPAWPTFQHDAARTGAAADCTSIAPVIGTGNVTTLVPRWFTPTSASVTASPAVVGDRVYIGDNGGLFQALDAATGASLWQFNIASNSVHNDTHTASYGYITSSAAYGADPVTGAGTVYFGGGGSIFALDAATGAPRWATDMDADNPTSPMEVESSPLLYRTPGGRTELIVGTDVNEATGNTATGLVSLDAATGALLWKFNPETKSVLHTLGSVPGYACGDVWGSPALDAADKLVVFGTGNCPDPDQAAAAGVTVPSEALWAISVVDGSFRWVFSQASTQADATYGGDDDLGPTPIVAPDTVNGRRVVLVASKAGYVFALDAQKGKQVWGTQASQPGQIGPAFAGALGGFIASDAVGRAGVTGQPAFFAASAVPLPFAGEGPTSDGGPQVDTTLVSDPERAASLHAVDVATGRVLWHQPIETASYAPVTYAHGVVFAPASTSFTAAAYDAATGQPLWVAPLAAAPASAVAVVGPNIFFGAGTTFSPGQPVPPQNFGVWSFGLAGSDPAPTLPVP
jgi:polyvinyl alcohol dehydrogenase (cytochrome)